MNQMKLIGGQKLRELGSDRHTDDLDYLIYDAADKRLFIHLPGQDIINAAAHPFYAAVWSMDATDDVSVAALLEMCVFAFVNHCENGSWDKADAKEYDIKFLSRLIKKNGQEVKFEIAKNFISSGAITEVNKIINSVKI
jgi:hypothetical protein